jgi:DNA polymerase I-like protein with 3'-5' exonuclease and polymerase domains
MIVSRDSFDLVLEKLKAAPRLALDTETSGLRPYHGDRLFSIIIATSATDAYYFNFQAAEDIAVQYILTPAHIARLRELFADPLKLWYLHNAKYDMSILANEECFLAGTIHCTKAQGLVEYNEHQSYALDASLRRIGLEKGEGPEKWIEENKAWEWSSAPHRKSREKNLFFTRVPFPIITEYGEGDATGTFALGGHQEKSITLRSIETTVQNSTAAPVTAIMENERELTKTVFDMERHGILIDLDYCKRAAAREEQLLQEATSAFETYTQKPYKSNSQPLFKEVFAEEATKWEYNKPTKTGQINPCFESEVLKKFSSPAAKSVLAIRDHESRWRFYMGFLYYADARGRVHPNFNPDGAGHGRFSSSNPNFQNLTSDTVQVCKACGHEHEEMLNECEKCGSFDLLKKDWLVRQAIIPSPGTFLLSIDYNAMEYKFMLEYACQQVGYLTKVAERVRNGEDVHQVCADIASQRSGILVTRKQAKTSNFLMLYGGGAQKLADQLGITLDQAYAIRRAILGAIPEVDILIKAVTRAAEQRGYIRNWAGRICHFPDTRWAYRGTNYLIAGGCADVVKIAMNRVHKLLLPYKSKMILQVHDELDFEIAYGEELLVPQIKEIMETAYVGKYMNLTCSVSYSKTNLADLSAWAA